jgi:quinohemoprotein ethanol dehydrogenase
MEDVHRTRDPSKGFESKALERAAATWHGRYWESGGAGNVLDAIVYDPALELVYFGTANAHPWYRDLRGDGDEGGDNLYISSILALRVGNGDRSGTFQTAPATTGITDATQLRHARRSLYRRPPRVIMQANKNVFLHPDRETGSFSRQAYAYEDGQRLDEKTGRPIETKTAYAHASRSCRHRSAAHTIGIRCRSVQPPGSSTSR